MNVGRTALVGPGMIVLVVALAAACSGSGTTASPPRVTSAPSSAPVPASPLIGVLIAVDSAGLDKVAGFTVRLADGTEVPLTIGTLENGAEFPPGHLTEHLASAEPVRVFFRPEGGALVVYRIEDAG